MVRRRFGVDFIALELILSVRAIIELTSSSLNLKSFKWVCNGPFQFKSTVLIMIVVFSSIVFIAMRIAT